MNDGVHRIIDSETVENSLCFEKDFGETKTCIQYMYNSFFFTVFYSLYLSTFRNNEVIMKK